MGMPLEFIDVRKMADPSHAQILLSRPRAILANRGRDIFPNHRVFH